MMSLYYLAGEDLVATHYCVAGNQPHLKLDRAKSTESELRFAFDFGTNMNPATDTHMHEGIVRLVGERLEHTWLGWAGGKPEEQPARLFLARAKK
jgi:hypothetical protein